MPTDPMTLSKQLTELAGRQRRDRGSVSGNHPASHCGASAAHQGSPDEQPILMSDGRPLKHPVDPLAAMAQDIANSLGITGASNLHTIRADCFRVALCTEIRAELSKRGIIIPKEA